ncbi:MAG: dTDP-4-dehydrorhamnose 3,5-epimerase family protein [Actinobacteria bacterium]|nr:dTDP-4-dehydrorhamnose 3,5-epimerase family protein [Actinomycetota bacterium]MDI6831222.1 dTDP-4-dehydrorhamnose 3,5-epimerase family protein [Actinomycetota bacterium]
MIAGVEIRELDTDLDAAGATTAVWAEGAAPRLSSLDVRRLFPGVVEAWTLREEAAERVFCLQGMIKLVLCDRREGSPTRDEVMELFLGEYRPREVLVPPGVLRGWKAVGGREAMVCLALEGGGGARTLSREEARVPYDWEIVMR